MDQSRAALMPVKTAGIRLSCSEKGHLDMAEARKVSTGQSLGRDELEHAEFLPRQVPAMGPNQAGRRWRCRVRFQKVLWERTGYGAFQMLCQVIESGHPLEGQPLVCFFNAPEEDTIKSAGKCLWSARSKYAKAWIMANGGTFPPRWDRLAPKIFKGKTFEAEIVESRKEDLTGIIPNPGEYKIRRLVSVVPEGIPTESFLIQDTQRTESNQKPSENVTGCLDNYALHHDNDAVHLLKSVNRDRGSIKAPEVATPRHPIPRVSSAPEGREMTDRFEDYGIVIDHTVPGSRRDCVCHLS